MAVADGSRTSKDFAARSLLLKLEARGLLGLPPLRAQYQTRRWAPEASGGTPWGSRQH